MGIFLIIVLILWLLWPYIMRLVQRYLAHKAEDMARRMMGQPTRKEEKKQRRRAAKDSASTPPPPPHMGERRDSHAAEMMREVAEDVVFTEVHEFSDSELEFEKNGDISHRQYHERQVEDVRFTEIKDKE